MTSAEHLPAERAIGLNLLCPRYAVQLVGFLQLPLITSAQLALALLNQRLGQLAYACSVWALVAAPAAALMFPRRCR